MDDTAVQSVLHVHVYACETQDTMGGLSDQGVQLSSIPRGSYLDTVCLHEWCDFIVAKHSRTHIVMMYF